MPLSHYIYLLHYNTHYTDHFPRGYFILAERVQERAPEGDIPRLGFEIEAASNRMVMTSDGGLDAREMKTDAFLRALKKTPMNEDRGFHPTAEPNLFASNFRANPAARQTFKMEYVSDPFPLDRAGVTRLVEALHRLDARRSSREVADYHPTVRFDSTRTHMQSSAAMTFRHSLAWFPLIFQVTVGVNVEKLLSDSEAVRARVVRCFSASEAMTKKIGGLLSAAVAAEEILAFFFPGVRGNGNPRPAYGLRLSLLLYLIQLDYHFSGSQIIPKDWLHMNFKGGSSMRACGMSIAPFLLKDPALLRDPEAMIRAMLADSVVHGGHRHFLLKLVGLPGMNFDTMYYRGGGIPNFIYGGQLYTVVEARKSTSLLAKAVEKIAAGSSDLDELGGVLENLIL